MVVITFSDYFDSQNNMITIKIFANYLKCPCFIQLLEMATTKIQRAVLSQSKRELQIINNERKLQKSAKQNSRRIIEPLYKVKTLFRYLCNYYSTKLRTFNEQRPAYYVSWLLTKKEQKQSKRKVRLRRSLNYCIPETREQASTINNSVN